MTKQRCTAKPWVLRDPEMLRMVLQAFEDLTTLRQHCAEKIQRAREHEYLFQNVPVEPDKSGLQRWRGVRERIMACWRFTDDLVRTSQFDAARCQDAYRDLIWIQMAWRHLDPRSASLSLIEQITDHLRQLLIGAAQRQPARGGNSS